MQSLDNLRRDPYAAKYVVSSTRRAGGLPGARRGNGGTVAIGVVFEAVGVTQAQYDQVRQQVVPDNKRPPGMLYHAGGPTETGFCVIETWETAEAAQEFAEQKLSRALEDAGVNVQPRFFQVYNVLE